jgi:hypothetical protein
MRAPDEPTRPKSAIEDPPDIDETIWMAHLIEIIAVASAIAFALARIW